ncbi:MAG TPA: NFACT RNA binding domain-containing protein [Candidatus Baltobacteraceae bacterium]|nr:NFACT RNA binding domain-containing protein [Candidatus Baltobacteraceae bacterium]
MYTDWLLIRRLALELSHRFKGARVRDVGQLEDGRFALALWSRGKEQLVCADVFAPTPVLTVEDGELPIAVEPGFVRAAGAALRGTVLSAVLSRRGDRLIRMEFGSRSRFGVEDRIALVFELVPRFGNIVLLKGDTVVAALKEFAPSENAVRSIQAGDAYELPPLRTGKSSPLLSEEQIAQLSEDLPEGDLHVYRRDGALMQAHLVELPEFAALEHKRTASLLDVLAEARETHAHAQQSDRSAKRRNTLERALAARERKLRSELAQVRGKLREAESREKLREEGDTIYATLHELTQTERDEAKERAAKLFAAYKKAAASVSHLKRRQAELIEALEDLAQVQWEVERAGEGELDDAAEAVQALEPVHRSAPAKRTASRRRKPLQYETSSGSRIYVGRTPLENAELTFHVARPGDLWFHVQNQPGAHVILQRHDREEPPDEDVLAAASLAALHSKAKNSPKVTVDYTQRKYVRKRPGAAPGLVFYTHPKSVHVEPRGIAPGPVSSNARD